MGWMYCGLDHLGREIGYGIVATCDRYGCDEVIDRGLGYICGSMHHGPFDMEPGCGRYYCGKHQGWVGPRGGCSHGRRMPFKAWGRTKCQLMRREGKPRAGRRPDGVFDWLYGPDIYYCACREWEYDGPDLSWDFKHDFEDPWLTNPTRVAGYREHVDARGFACLGALYPNGEAEVLTT